MSTSTSGTFKITKWDEQPYDEIASGPKLTRASVTQAFTGGIEGEGAVEYIMMHRSDKSAIYVGLLRVDGRIGTRSGTFVLRCQGTYAEGTATCSWSVVPGSGTGELSGLRGDGDFSAGHGGRASYTFAYDFE
ncbi:MAG: DUF3224 domain-containing protein [Planctomycetota bacterium]|jgi:hypothetical protein